MEDLLQQQTDQLFLLFHQEYEVQLSYKVPGILPLKLMLLGFKGFSSTSDLSLLKTKAIIGGINAQVKNVFGATVKSPEPNFINWLMNLKEIKINILKK